MTRGLRAAGFALAVLALPACRRPAPPLNLLIVTLDTTRGDRFGCYGYKAAHTPNLDALAAKGIRFDQAVTAVPITLPSHASILTGTYPVFHGIHDNDGYRLDDGVSTLAERLKAGGFETAAFVGSYPLDSQFHLDQGFDAYDDDFQRDWTPAEARARTPLAFGFVERTSDQVNAAASRWLETHGQERFFAWVHYFDPHQPYDPPRPYDTQFAGTPYDGEIAFVDESFGKLLGMLQAKGVLERTIVLVVGDHGESLEQHGELTHASFLYDTTIRVPLLLSVPGRFSPGRRIARQVRTIDLMPTLLELLRLPPSHDAQGKSLVPLLEDPKRPWEEEALLESDFNRFQYGWAPLRGLRTGRYKLIEAPKLELYDLALDPGETRNLVGSQPALVAELRERLSRLAHRMQAPDPARSTGSVSPEAQEKLQALGYVGGGSDASRRAPFPAPEALAVMKNPADQTLVLNIVNVAQEQLRKRRFDTCIAAARNGLAMDESNYRLRVTLAECQAMMGRYDQALQEVARAEALRQDDQESFALEGRIHILRGQLEAGVKALEKAARIAPQFPENLRALATAYVLVGRDREAIQHFEAVLRLDERSWAAHLDIAGAYARTGRLEDARRSYQRALELNPYSPAVLFDVGAFYARVGDAAFARQMFEAVLRIAPDNPAALVSLGELLLADPAQAEAGRERLRRAIEIAPRSPAAKRARELLGEAPPGA